MTEQEINDYIAKQLRTLRATSGMSQTQLGREMDFSPQQVQKYEWGINSVSAAKAYLYADVFDVPVSVLYPARDGKPTYEPIEPATMRFVRLINKIDPKHYDQVYIALRAISALSTQKGR